MIPLLAGTNPCRSQAGGRARCPKGVAVICPSCCPVAAALVRTRRKLGPTRSGPADSRPVESVSYTHRRRRRRIPTQPCIHGESHDNRRFQTDNVPPLIRRRRCLCCIGGYHDLLCRPAQRCGAVGDSALRRSEPGYYRRSGYPVSPDFSRGARRMPGRAFTRPGRRCGKCTLPGGRRSSGCARGEQPSPGACTRRSRFTRLTLVLFCMPGGTDDCAASVIHQCPPPPKRVPLRPRL
jgi:hypothetical protein